MLSRIEAAEHIALIAHVNPDADSLGSACCFYAHLLRLQKKVTLFCASEMIDARLGCIPWSEKVTSRWNDSADLAIAFDCGSYDRMGVAPACTLVNIDHHTGNDGFGDLRLLDKSAISTTAILMQWFRKKGIRINAKMATALYAGIAEDTVGFMSKRTDGEVFAMAAELAQAGADITAVNHALFLRKPLASLRLKGMIFAGLELLSDARIAVMRVSRDMMASSGGDAAACENALHEALGLPTIFVAVLLRERRDGSVKVSLRTDNGIDVGVIAESFGGGGHHFASGFVSRSATMDSLVRDVVEKIEKELK